MAPLDAQALESVARHEGGRIVAALAGRFRDLDLAEDAFAEACARAAERWSRDGSPRDPAAWLYRTADRIALDALRRRQTRQRHAAEPRADETTVAPSPEDLMADDGNLIPDERLKLIFVCCHPAIAPEARAALTLKLVCGLSTIEIARAFLVAEPTLAQRLVRAKRKIAEAGIPFAIPERAAWPERLDAVLSTLEVAYAKAHEDAAGAGPHAGFATEMLDLTRALAHLLPCEPDVLAFAATVRYAEARRPARLGDDGVMVPLSEQDPALWRRPLIDEAEAFLKRAAALADRPCPRAVQAAIHAAWCDRRSLAEPPPWPMILRLYDLLLIYRDDPVVHINRAVALAEVAGVDAALVDIEGLRGAGFAAFLPYHALRADLMRRIRRWREAEIAYDAALALGPGPAERLWLERGRAGVRSMRDA